VTLLGDAVHTMTPGHGVGANTALRDAALLCRALTEVHTGQRQLHDAVSDYEQQVIPYGFERVRDSLIQNATRGDDPLYRPATRRLALFGARTYSSLTSKVPSMRQKFVDSMTEYRGADF
jgi:2-polyprenyl-6-methoxyphenol hydroxylase-like FAD-dependent oxidoreductase